MLFYVMTKMAVSIFRRAKIRTDLCLTGEAQVSFVLLPLVPDEQLVSKRLTGWRHNLCSVQLLVFNVPFHLKVLVSGKTLKLGTLVSHQISVRCGDYGGKPVSLVAKRAKRPHSVLAAVLALCACCGTDTIASSTTVCH